MMNGEPVALHRVDEQAAGMALDDFARAHYHRLIRLASLVCRSTSDAEDAVQAALERAWRKRDALRDADSLRPWLDRIVVREAIRASRSRSALLGRLSPREPQEIDVPASPRPDAPTEWIEMRIEFERLIPEHRAVLVLHLYAGYSVAETARIVGIPVETARTRIRVAKERLRARLDVTR